MGQTQRGGRAAAAALQRTAPHWGRSLLRQLPGGTHPGSPLSLHQMSGSAEIHAAAHCDQSLHSCAPQQEWQDACSGKSESW